VTVGWTEEGVASWYGHPFHGRQTASGEIYDMESETAAHQTLPFGTVVEVENLHTGARTRLRINDRGPFVGGRILDVSRWGARELGMIGPGTAPVRIVAIEVPPPQRCWQVQVAAYEQGSHAQDALRRLESQGVPGRIEPGPGGVHRVRAGPWTTQAEARAFQRGRGGFVVGC
jgi:rare lipoprotein A